MNRCVLDASTVAAAFLQERWAANAQALLSGEATEFHAPDLLAAEFANVIWKRVTRGQLDAGEADALLSDFQRLPITWTASSKLCGPALAMASATGRTVYDCLYVALAVSLDCRMISADKRLVNALATTPLAKHVVWIGQRG